MSLCRSANNITTYLLLIPKTSHSAKLIFLKSFKNYFWQETIGNRKINFMYMYMQDFLSVLCSNVGVKTSLHFLTRERRLMQKLCSLAAKESISLHPMLNIRKYFQNSRHARKIIRQDLKPTPKRKLTLLHTQHGYVQTWELKL